jgi:hypothetical protein
LWGHIPDNDERVVIGSFLIADADNNRVRRVSPAGTITIVAGTGTAGRVRVGAGLRPPWPARPGAVARLWSRRYDRARYSRGAV